MILIRRGARIGRVFVHTLVAAAFTALLAGSAAGQTVAKYGSAFLDGGVGARALGMGGASVALVNDVTAAYWNVAGLSALEYPQAAYMHAERFSGLVAFDYAGFALPLNSRSTFGLSFFRSGVDDIPNTWNAWDPVRNQPKPRPENHITFFSAVDYAFFTSYARTITPNLWLGLTGKIIRRSTGDYMNGWGYSLDVAAQYRAGRLLLGAALQDATTMLVSYSIDEEAVRPLGEIFDLPLPQGGSELYLPVARLGSGYLLPLGAGGTELAVGFDVDLRSEGRQAYALNTGEISYHPRIGTELSVRDVVALRAGLTDLTVSDDLGWQYTPTVGAGLAVSRFHVDYAFGDFAGLASDLGYSHRLSVQLTLAQPGMRRVTSDE